MESVETTQAPVEEYTAPALIELGTVTEATLGSKSANNADDTQYWQ